MLFMLSKKNLNPLSPKTRGIFSTVCTFPLLDIHGLKYVFETLKCDNSDSNVLLFQDPNRHLSSMAIILWTTKDQTFILIFFLGVNMLFYVVDSSYPTTKSQRLTLLLQHGLV